MFGEVATLLGQFAGGSAEDRQAAQSAAEDHVQSLPADQVQDHVQTAADNAQSSGQAEIANVLQGLLSGSGNDQDLKSGLINLVKSNPQILTHFAPEFAQGILSRI